MGQSKRHPKTEIHSIIERRKISNSLTLHVEEPEKEQTTKPQISRKRNNKEQSRNKSLTKAI